MKKVILLTILAFSMLHLNAQITGQVFDDGGERLPFVNVLILSAVDSSLVSATLTDEAGHFLFEQAPEQDYLLSVQTLAYRDWYSTTTRGNQSFGDIQLEAAAYELDVLEVTARKKLIQQSGEGTIVNVQSSLLTKGSSALQLLERLPGVYIDRRNNDLSLNGQSGATIMLDGRTLRLPLSELISLLEGMSANEIENIELLTSPSAKYDAEGSSGMINIVRKEQKDNGTNGSYTLSGAWGAKPKASGSVQLYHQDQKKHFSASYAYLYDASIYDWRATGFNNIPALIGAYDIDYLHEGKQRKQSHNLSMTYGQQLSENTTIGGDLHYSRIMDRPDRLNTGNYFFHSQDSFFQMKMHQLVDNRWDNLVASIFLDQQLHKGGQLSVAADYLYHYNESPSLSSSSFHNLKGERLTLNDEIFATSLKGVNQTSIRVGAFKVDYEKSWSSKIKLQLGFKGSYAKNENQGGLERKVYDHWEVDPRASTSLEGYELITAAYTSTQWKMSDAIDLTLGLRYEYWQRELGAEQGNRQQNQFFPSVHFSQQLTDDQFLRFSYSRRTNRPSYNDLASYISYNGPVSVMTGNPLLQPTISNKLRLNYQLKGVNMALQYQRDKHPIQRYQLTANDTEDLLLVSPQNLDFEQIISFQLDWSTDPTPWWQSQLGLIGSHRSYRLLHTLEKAEKRYVAFNMYGNQQFQLPLDLSLEISGWYNSGFYEGSRKVDGFGMLNAGIRKSLKKGRGSLQLAVENLLQSMRITSYFGRVTPEVFEIFTKVYYRPESARARIFRLTYSRPFGNRKMTGRRKKQSASDEERSRLRTGG
ncbi:MAG: TonB-dependent receptor [Bacteroidota bacterium]